MGRRRTVIKTFGVTTLETSGNDEIPEAYHCTLSETPLPAKKLPRGGLPHPMSPARRSQSMPCISTISESSVASSQEEDEDDHSNEPSDATCTSLPPRVSFSSLEIRSYSTVIGDHPCTSGGCAVALGWDFVSLGSVSLDHYEDCRPPRRTLSEMRLTAMERQELLLEHNHDPTDVRRASRKLHRARSCVARIGGRMNDCFFHGEA